MPTAIRAMPDEIDGRLDSVFAALSDPTRRSILTHLAQGEATVSELATPFNMSLPGVSKHVSVLEEAGLVRRWRVGRTRRCSLEAGGIDAANVWLSTCAKYWTDTLDSLAEFIEGDEED